MLAAMSVKNNEAIFTRQLILVVNALKLCKTVYGLYRLFMRLCALQRCKLFQVGDSPNETPNLSSYIFRLLLEGL